MDESLIKTLTLAAASAGFPAPTITSGAGHDAMVIADRVPSALVFLRTPAGFSHCPQESVRPEDVAAALATGLEFLAHLANSHCG